MARVRTLREFQTGFPFEVEGFTVLPIALSHDAADPVAFALEKEGEKVGCVTDLGRPTDRVLQGLSKCHILLLEFNHDPQMLQNGPYPTLLKQRVSSGHGHLSNQEAGKLLEAVLHPELRHLFLAHISQVNNLPQLALLAAEEVLRRADAKPMIHLTWQNFVSTQAVL